MNKWLQLPINFSDRLATLTLPARESPETLQEILCLAENDHERLQHLLAAFVCSYRQDLCGGTLLGCDFDFLSQQWRFLYTHPSLPTTRLGQYPAVLPLIEETELDVVTGPVKEVTG